MIFKTVSPLSTTFSEEELRRVHVPMAYMVDQAKIIYSFRELPEPAKRMFAMFRFTPVLRDNEGKGFILDRTKSLCRDNTPEEVRHTMGYECMFVSGFLTYEEWKSKIKPDSEQIDAQYFGVRKSGIFLHLPPVSYEIPFRFMMRNYVDPEYLRHAVDSRYPDSKNLRDSLLHSGDYSKIFSIHEETRKSLDLRNQKISTALNAALSCVDTTDVNTLLTELDGLKAERRKVGNNALANSYTCAEQLALDFMSTGNMQNYLKEITCSERDEVVGMIVHVHTTETPCCTCATSLTRESEAGGLFKSIFGKKPVKIVCTSSEHYVRKVGIMYEDTEFREVISQPDPQPVEFDVSSTAKPSHYPVILFRKNEAAETYDIFQERYAQFEQPS